MNIFVTHKNPAHCARALDNVRLNKMTVETAQIISTVLRITYHDETPALYRPAYRHHPCVKWAMKRPEHLVWLIHLFFEYTNEYTRRFQKVHLSEATLASHLTDVLSILPPLTTEIDFYNGSAHKELPVFEAYRLTLREKWQQDALKGRPPRFS